MVLPDAAGSNTEGFQQWPQKSTKGAKGLWWPLALI
jgi:hypothetical protein